MVQLCCLDQALAHGVWKFFYFFFFGSVIRIGKTSLRVMIQPTWWIHSTWRDTLSGLGVLAVGPAATRVLAVQHTSYPYSSTWCDPVVHGFPALAPGTRQRGRGFVPSCPRSRATYQATTQLEVVPAYPDAPVISTATDNLPASSGSDTPPVCTSLAGRASGCERARPGDASHWLVSACCMGLARLARGTEQRPCRARLGGQGSCAGIWASGVAPIISTRRR